MRALKPGGILSVTLWNKEEPPKSVLKLYATMAEAARDVDGGRHRRHVLRRLDLSVDRDGALQARRLHAGGDRQAARPHQRDVVRRDLLSRLQVDTADLPQILQDYRDQFFSTGEAADPTGAVGEGAERQAAARRPGAEPAEGAAGGHRRRPKVPATVLGRLAWHHLVDGGWQKVADAYVFDTRIAHQRPALLRRLRQACGPAASSPTGSSCCRTNGAICCCGRRSASPAVSALSLVLFPLIFGWRTIFSRYPGQGRHHASTSLCLGLGYIMVEVGLISHFMLALSNADRLGVGADHRHAGLLRPRQPRLRALPRPCAQRHAADLPRDRRHPDRSMPVASTSRSTGSAPCPTRCASCSACCCSCRRPS